MTDITGMAKSTVRVVHSDDCIFHFYLSVDDLNPSGEALIEIQNVVPTRIKYILNTLEKQPMQCINFSVVWFD